MMECSQREKVVLPDGHEKLLFHVCCAPCSGGIIDTLLFSKIDFTIFFYNPNIHPRKEYILRKNSIIAYAEKLGVPFIDADYDSRNWFERAKGMEFEPERGVRCTMCFDMRLECSAFYAHEHGFSVLATSLGISRWKNLKQVNDCGERAVAPYEDMIYWDYNWRKKGGIQLKDEIRERERFYMQEYCGCSYSLRDSNEWRLSKGRKKIKIGVQYYCIKDADK